MKRRLALFGVLIATVLAYLPSMAGEFQFDDVRGIAKNLDLRDLGHFLRLGFFSRFAGGRPLTDLTFALDYAAGGLDVRWFHATNVALHLAVVLLVYLLTLVTLERAGAGRRPWAALAVAAIFALHPLQSQAVSYVVQRAEVLASLLYVGSLLLLLRADDEPSPARAAAWYACGAGVFVLGLGAKPIVATLPVAFLLHRLALAHPDGGRRPGWRTIAFAAPLLASAAALAARTAGGIPANQIDVGFHLPTVSPREYLLTQLRVLVRYLQLSFWPAGQNLDYDFPKSVSLDGPTLASGCLLLCIAAAGGAAWVWARRRPQAPDAPAARVFALGAGWFFLVLAPSSSVIPLIDFVVEHRMYLALWGVLMMLLGGTLAVARHLTEQARPFAAALVVAAVLPLLGGTLLARNQVWRTRLNLWSDVAAKSPNKARAHLNLGQSLYQAGRAEEAVAEYRKALLLETDGTTVREDTLRNLGAALLALGRCPEAIPTLQMGLAFYPNNDELLSNLASCRFRLGDVGGAESSARRALELNPRQGSAHNTLGEILFLRHDYAAALEEFQAGVSLAPESAAQRYNYAITLEQLGTREQICAAWLRALVTPGLPSEHAVIEARAARLGCAPAR